MAEILRGSIYWCRLDPAEGHEQKSHRPVLVISHDVFNQSSGTVIALAITSQPQKVPFPLTLKLPELLVEKESWVKISQVRILSTKRLGEKLDEVDQDFLSQVVEGLQQIVA